MSRINFTIYKNSILASVVSFLGTAYIYLGGLLALISVIEGAEDLGEGIIVCLCLIVFGIWLLWLAKKISERKQRKELKKKSNESDIRKSVSEQKVFTVKSYEVKQQSNSNEGAYFDMKEYFCNGHDDTAVDVILYDCSGNELSRKTFSWEDGEVTSSGIWGMANEYAQSLELDGAFCRNKEHI